MRYRKAWRKGNLNIEDKLLDGQKMYKLKEGYFHYFEKKAAQKRYEKPPTKNSERKN